jgi:hypothetical protein
MKTLFIIFILLFRIFVNAEFLNTITNPYETVVSDSTNIIGCMVLGISSEYKEETRKFPNGLHRVKVLPYKILKGDGIETYSTVPKKWPVLEVTLRFDAYASQIPPGEVGPLPYVNSTFLLFLKKNAEGNLEATNVEFSLIPIYPEILEDVDAKNIDIFQALLKTLESPSYDMYNHIFLFTFLSMNNRNNEQMKKINASHENYFQNFIEVLQERKAKLSKEPSQTNPND